jgi:ABC-type lipoprotein export system ATPase subunit
LLHLLGVLDRPSAGTVHVEGVDPWHTGRDARAGLRLRRIGFVFQQSNLMPFLSARDNVSLPAWRLGGDRRKALVQADLLLERFGLGARSRAPGGELSLGEAQRVAIARALVNRPALILADEPTGSLDSAATEAVLAGFDDIVREGTTLLVATHDPRVAGRMRRIIRMRDGAVETESISN